MERLKEHDRFDGRWCLRVQSDGSLLPPSDEGYWMGRPYQGDDHSPPWSPLFSLALSDGGSEPKKCDIQSVGTQLEKKLRGC